MSEAPPLTTPKRLVGLELSSLLMMARAFLPISAGYDTAPGGGGHSGYLANRGIVTVMGAGGRLGVLGYTAKRLMCWAGFVAGPGECLEWGNDSAFYTRIRVESWFLPFMILAYVFIGWSS